MAKMNLYIPDAMKAEMDEVGSRVNWSSAAQAAFDQELKRLRWPKEPTMEQVIERLKASKIAFAVHEAAEGLKHGREWAMLRADYSMLKRMAAINFKFAQDDSFREYSDRALGLSVTLPSDSFWYDFESETLNSDEYIESFVAGAKEVWEQVKDQLS